MNVSTEKGAGNVSPAWLKAHLKLLCGVKPPNDLRDKLLAAAPRKVADRPRGAVVRRWHKAAGYVGVAAAVIVAASLFLRFVAPMGRSQAPTVDINDRRGAALTADYNSPRPRDTNVCDNNALY